MSEDRSKDRGAAPPSPEAAGPTAERAAGARGAHGDRALVLGALPEQKGIAILRQRGEDAPVEAGVLRGVREGEPIVGEVVSLTPTAEDARLCDVKVHVDARPKAREAAGSDVAHKGPPRVASEAYRSGWDALFGEPGSSGRALN